MRSASLVVASGNGDTGCHGCIPIASAERRLASESIGMLTIPCYNIAMRKRLWRSTPEERFWFYTEKSTGCWLWTGPRHGGTGTYGVIVVSYNYDFATKRSIKHTTMAHRYSWQLHFGIIPEGLLVCHSCDVPLCVNPSHLFLGTIQDNMTDRNRKSRQAQHERHGRAKLSWEQVADIRKAFDAGASKLSLSKKYGVVHNTIRGIISQRTWKSPQP